MGVYHECGYSATVEGFLLVDGTKHTVAKSNYRAIVLVESRAVEPGQVGELVVIVDGNRSSRLITISHGVAPGQTVVPYEVAAPF